MKELYNNFLISHIELLMDDARTNRRNLLRLIGASASAIVAGCGDSSEGESVMSDSDKLNSTELMEPEENERDSGSRIYYIGSDGDDENSGRQLYPLNSVSEGIDRARPGDIVWIRPGEYRETVRTVRSGRQNAPITIIGSSDAVIRPPIGSDNCIRIGHNHIHVRGVSINGLLNSERRFEDYRAWAKRCVLITPKDNEKVDYLRNIVVEPSLMGGCSRPMVRAIRLRNASIGGFKMDGPAGMQFDPRVDNHEEGRIREVVYLGTPEIHRDKPFYPWDALDQSRNIRVHHINNSEGYAHNELVDIKLGTTDVTVEYCTDRNSEVGRNTSSVVTIGGNSNVIRWNDIADCDYGLRFGAWTPSGDIDSDDWAQNNSVYGNRITEYDTEPILFWNNPEWDLGPSSSDVQKTICNNQIEGNKREFSFAQQSCKNDLPEGNGVGHTN